MKQTTLIAGECQHTTDKWMCARPATYGVYRIAPMGLDRPVELDLPSRICCGQHKPRFNHRHLFRNVKLNPAL